MAKETWASVSADPTDGTDVMPDVGPIPVDLFMHGANALADARRSRRGSVVALTIAEVIDRDVRIRTERKLESMRRFVQFRDKANGHNIHTKAAAPPAPDEAAAAVRAYLEAGGTVTRCPDMAAGDFHNGDGFGA
jgi:hypothetical protein